jgi:hypothetical protein
MVVAVVTVRVVQVAIHQVINVITMGYRLMTAVWAVYMIGGVAGALMVWRAALGVVSVHRQAVLVDMVTVHMVQMAVMQEINVAIVLDSRMATPGFVLVTVVGMLCASTHIERLYLR